MILIEDENRVVCSCRTDEDSVQGDVDQLDHESCTTDDQEANTNSLEKSSVLGLVGLLAPLEELDALLDELARGLEKVLNLIIHFV